MKIFDNSDDVVRTVDAVCPEGNQAVGGGFWISDAAVRVIENLPTDRGDAWRIKTVGTSRNYMLRAYALCLPE